MPMSNISHIDPTTTLDLKREILYYLSATISLICLGIAAFIISAKLVLADTLIDLDQMDLIQKVFLIVKNFIGTDIYIIIYVFRIGLSMYKGGIDF